MKRSLIACWLAVLVLLTYRISYMKLDSKEPFVVTTWDALGYYFYLPSAFIYHDASELKWFSKIDSAYSVSGGQLYQAGKSKNGNYVFNYLSGVAILQAPFFLTAHAVAGIAGYARDGFSPPYQYAIAFSAIIYCVLGIFLLRKILLNYFDDATTAVTLLLLLLASNFVQYVSIDGAMSHSYIFSMYVLVLYAAMKWHEKPAVRWACITGFIIGLATISRPTELIILFIPLLWGLQTKESSKQKWDSVKANKSHIVYAALCGFIGVLPQMIYWKITSGSFIYDVGSKWDFLSPHFRVLFGWEKGWFIYTPVTVLFVAGLFFMKKFPFRKSVITFCLLNIWVITAWHDWRYGASYSCRALVESYPVFALALGTFIQKINFSRWKYAFYAVGCYLIFVNLFQIVQYNSTLLHYNDMNRKYYSGIYLNMHPSPFDMSLLDTDEMLTDESNYQKIILANADSISNIALEPYASSSLFETKISTAETKNNNHEDWIKIEATITIRKGTWGCFINSELQTGDSIKHDKVRLQNAISSPGKDNEYGFYVKVPEYFRQSIFRLSIYSPCELEGEIKKMKVTRLTSR
ncbi:MAG: glycosyltransferase family 39 protein [Bacteroidetes bacterium]|nr:glycosyltransferase family 39 protein [Bacteroidota bacterium]